MNGLNPLESKHAMSIKSDQYDCGFVEMQGYRNTMEDESLICYQSEQQEGEYLETTCFGVFDGHGGSEASKFVKEHLVSTLSLPSHILTSADHPLIVHQIELLDQAFRTSCDHDNHASRAGTTCCVALFQTCGTSKQLTIVNIGDSRALLYSKEGTLLCVTEDHKPDNDRETTRIQEAGGLVVCGRVNGQLAVSRAIGDFNYKMQRLIPEAEQWVVSTPDIYTWSIPDESRLLVCCDGIFEKLSNEQVIRFLHALVTLNPGMSPKDQMLHLVEYALESGSKDNMTAMLTVFTSDKNDSINSTDSNNSSNSTNASSTSPSSSSPIRHIESHYEYIKDPEKKIKAQSDEQFRRIAKIFKERQHTFKYINNLKTMEN
ncbi:MAG: phosphatase 2C [Sylvanvirus sp.]|uniref:Phosphatase 2C n=1 Tax=Sylvanvirus sp. TaxID=2487774 RepID=A0A3G5AHH6_9VIRU|nr:MAG: phosphatase 2C [Sylvanvirus sp.]